MADNFGIYNITGEIEANPSSTLPGTSDFLRRLQNATFVEEYAQLDLNAYDDVTAALSFLASNGSTDRNDTQVQVGDILRWRILKNGVTVDDFFDVLEVGVWYTGFANAVYLKLAGAYDFSTMTGAVMSGTVFRTNRFSDVDKRPKTVNERRKYERSVVDKRTLGTATKFEVGELAPPGYVNTFNLGDPFTPAYGGMIASADSWTQRPHGLSHGFVIPEISSSHHEASSLNAFLSGTAPLEVSPIPASGNLYYSKSMELVRSVYKLSASVNLPLLPTGQDHSPATDENVNRSGTANFFVAGSGSYRNTSIFNPSIFEIDVPEYGKIRDVKVWVEFVHDHRGGTGTGSFSGNQFLKGGTGATGSYSKQGLQGVQIALRSPNVDFQYAHPLWNDPQTSGFTKWPKASLNAKYKGIPELHRGSYLLWAGHACEEDLGMSLGRNTSSLPDNTFSVFEQASGTFGYVFSNAIGSNFSVSSNRTRGISIDQLNASYDFIFTTVDVVSGTWDVVQGGNAFGSPTPGGTETIDKRTYTNYPFTGPTGLRLRRGMNGKLYAFFLDDFFTGAFLFYTRPGGGGVPWMGSFGGASLHGASVTPTIGAPTGDGGGSSLATVTNLSGMLTTDIGKVLDFTAGTFADGNNNKEFLIREYVSANSVKVQSFNATAGTAGSAFTFAVKNNVGTQARLGGFDGAGDMAIDSAGVPHFVGVAWRGDLGDGVLNYGFSGSASVLDGPSNIDAIDTRLIRRPTAPYATENVGAFSQIEIDTGDRIHIAYQDHDNRAVKYATKPVAYTAPSDGFRFDFVAVYPSSYSPPGHISLAINPTDQSPALAWWAYDGITDRIFYAKSGSGGWSTEQVGEFPNIGKGTRLAFDKDGIPAISSCMPAANGIDRDAVFLFVSSSDFGWSTTVIPVTASSQFTADDTAIATDVDGTRHVLTVGDYLNAAFFHSLPNSSLYTAFTTGDVPLGKYFEYDTDIDMRTIFDDASTVPNPRHLEKYFVGTTQEAVSSSLIPGSLIIQEGAYPSPASASINIITDPSVTGGSHSYLFLPSLGRNTHLTGANFPWLLDDRIPPGNFYGRNYYSLVSSSLGKTPPVGWLSGPAGTANVNEFPTTGSNLGPRTIQPVYPLLDDVYVEKLTDQPQLTTENVNPLQQPHGKIIGFRPGLRGTEVHGKWKLMIGVAGDESGGNIFGNPRAGIFFRQFRLEFLLDKGEPVRNNSYQSKDRRFKKSGYVPTKAGRRLVHLMSGSAAWDIGINGVYTSKPEEYGRSIGITDATSSVSFAVFSQLTGSIIDLLSGSGDLAQVRSSYLTNEFGTPYIPITSGSSAIPSFDAFSVADATESRQIFAATLNPKTLISKDNTLRAHLSRANVLKTTRDTILAKVSLLKS